MLAFWQLLSELDDISTQCCRIWYARTVHMVSLVDPGLMSFISDDVMTLLFSTVYISKTKGDTGFVSIKDV